MNLKQINNVFLIGIGGIGMSALARYFYLQGKTVSGYDRNKTSLTEDLEKEGIVILYVDSVDGLPNYVLEDDTLVVFTPAVSGDSKVLNYFVENDKPIFKRAHVLGLIANQSFAIAVAGTHGKTTTSSLIAHIMQESQLKCNAFLGGIATNYGKNFLEHKESKYTVVEADEFDRSFLQLYPELAVVTSVDADHLDIYGDAEQIEDSFQYFVDQVSKEGKVFIKKGIYLNHPNSFTYGVNTDADFSAEHLRVIDGNYQVDILTPEAKYENVSFGLSGRHNVENALAAMAVTTSLGIDPAQVIASLKTFKGVKRRFEKIVEHTDTVYIDDYAHHPTELNACFDSIKEMYPGKKITGVFQPHLYSRTRDFMEGFAESLSRLDEVILLDIYPARELPIDGIDSNVLLDKIKIENKKLLSKSEVIEHVRNNKIEVLVTVGAGDIDQLVQPLKEVLQR